MSPAFAAPSIEQDPRWRAVIARDAQADGGFVFAVRSTGIYCRPSCPARRPKPENVAFHASPQEAEKAGFRACLRCRPAGSPPAEAMEAAAVQACRRIEAQIAAGESPPSLADLAAESGFSLFHFQRRFKALTGLTPRAYAAARRAERLRANLAGEPGRVTDALYDAGFGSSGRFYAQSSAMLGMAPTTYRRGGVRERIRFAVGASTLGLVLAARSEKGLCALLLGDEAEDLIRDLRRRFPKAEVVEADSALAETLAAAVALVEAPRFGATLPLDLRGTAFQARVWGALQAIPPGETVSYGEIARRIDAPKAVRAVAQACGANPVAIATPCHRVVGADGALSGYRWGLARKKALLEREKADFSERAARTGLLEGIGAI